MPIWLSGLDLGKRNDPSALVVVQATGTIVEYEYDRRLLGLYAPTKATVETLPIVRLDVRHVERFPLEMSYHAIAAAVEQRCRAIPQPRYLGLDLTGVGVAVYEMFHSTNPLGITITGGDQASIAGPNQVNVPKRDLVAAVQVGLQNKYLTIAKRLPQAELLTTELSNFREKRKALSGQASFEAWRERDHDDIVLALAIAVWMATQALIKAKKAVQNMLDAQATERLIQASSISPI